MRRARRARRVGAVRLTIGEFPDGGVKFEATGAAVRAPAAPPVRQPFTSGLSGEEFAKPTGLVLGISVEPGTTTR